MSLVIRVSMVVGLIILLVSPLFAENLVMVTPDPHYGAPVPTEQPAKRAVDPQLSPTDMVNAHDQVRTAVNAGTQVGPAAGVPGAGFQPVPDPLIGMVSWDNTVAASAQTWSDTCSWGHDPGPHGYGENLFGRAQTADPPVIWAETDAVVTQWAGESAHYDYVTNDTITVGEDVGHYTQVVWADSRTIGCGATQCTTGSPVSGIPNWVYVVCRYDALGNFVGVRPYCTTQYPDDCALPVEILTFSVE